MSAKPGRSWAWEHPGTYRAIRAVHQLLRRVCLDCMQALPTLLLFRDGRAVDRIEGLMPEASLLQRLRYYIGRLDLKFGRR